MQGSCKHVSEPSQIVYRLILLHESEQWAKVVVVQLGDEVLTNVSPAKELENGLINFQASGLGDDVELSSERSPSFKSDHRLHD
jgi:hypothetical protein